MKKYYIIIKGILKLNNLEVNSLKDLLKELMFYPRIDIEQDYLYAFSENNTIFWPEFIESTNVNFLVGLKLYESISFETTKQLEINFNKNKEKSLFKEIYNNDKSLFYYSIKFKITEQKKQEIFKTLYTDKEFLRSIKIYLEANQNKSKAAKVANLHRNSLENRLEKFYNVTGYDVRNFKDASFIYLFLKD